MNFVNNWSRPIELAADAESCELDLPGGNYLLTLSSPAGSAYEIVEARVVDGFAELVRAREGTAAQAWPAGSIVYCSITAGTLERLSNAGGGAAVGDLLVTMRNPGGGWAPLADGFIGLISDLPALAALSPHSGADLGSFFVRTSSLQPYGSFGAKAAWDRAATPHGLFARDSEGAAGWRRSTDDGVTWAALSLPAAMYGRFLCFDLATGDIYDSYMPASTVPALRRSRDGGNTWSSLTGPTALNAVHDIRSHNGTLIARANSDLFRSVDDGASWTQCVGDGISIGAVLFGRAIIATALEYDAVRWYAASAERGNGILVSADDGITWTKSPAVFPDVMGNPLQYQPAVSSICPYNEWGGVQVIAEGVAYETWTDVAYLSVDTSAPSGKWVLAGWIGGVFTLLGDGVVAVKNEFGAWTTTLAGQGADISWGWPFTPAGATKAFAVFGDASALAYTAKTPAGAEYFCVPRPRVDYYPLTAYIATGAQ